MSETPQLPSRPYIPSVSYAVPVVVVAEWLVLGGCLDAILPGIVAAVVLAASVVALVVRYEGASQAIFLLLGTLLIAAIAATLSAAATRTAELSCAEAFASAPVSSWEFRADSDATQGEYAWRCRATALFEGQALGRVWLTLPEAASRGEVISGVGSFSKNKDDSWGISAARRGIAGTVTLKVISSKRALGGLKGYIAKLHRLAVSSIAPSTSPERALLAGLVCGDREALNECGLNDAFAACGVAHMVAVSGSHLSAISGFLSQLLGRGRLRPAARMCLLGLTTGLFVLFCGAPASAVRAWCMSLAAFGSGLAGRRSHSLTGVSLVALAMALIDPGCAGDVGFILSVATVMALCIFSPYAAYLVDVVIPAPRLPSHLPGWGRRWLLSLRYSVCSAIATTLVAQLATLPIVVPLFGRISLVALAANLVLGPLFVPCVSIGLIATCFSWVPVAGPMLLAASDVVCRIVVVLVRSLAALPVCSVAVSSDGVREWVLTIAVFGSLLILWPQVSRQIFLGGMAALLAAGIAFFVRWRFFAPARIVVLDVGQGDAILVQDGPHALLVDTGPEGAVGEALAREHVYHLDAVLITHMHDDHYGGLAELDGVCAVGEVLVGEGVSDDEPAEVSSAISELCDGRQQELRYADEFAVGRFEIRVVSPLDKTDGSENADSVELVVSFSEDDRELSALLTGDAETEELEGLLRRGDVESVDLLKVGHHGSEASLTEEQACILAPVLSVASAGEGNSYGHPTEVCQDAIKASGSAFLCTMDVGDICVEPASEGLRVSVSRGSTDALRALAAVS